VRDAGLSKAVGAGHFSFVEAGIVAAFDSSSSFTLKQGGITSRCKKVPAQ